MKTPARLILIPAPFASVALFAAAAFLLNPAPAFAQDIKFTDPVISNPRAPTEPPTFAKEMSAANLDYMPDLPTYAYMHVLQTVNSDGSLMTNATTGNALGITYSTDSEMFKAFPAENRNIQFTPAMRDGNPVRAGIHYTLIYNPASAPETGPDAAPRLLHVTMAQVDRTAWFNINDRKNVAWLKATIDENGTMTKCILNEKNSAWAAPLQDDIYKAVNQWEFAPARRDGNPVPAEISLPVCVVPLRSPPTSAPLKTGTDGAVGPRARNGARKGSAGTGAATGSRGVAVGGSAYSTRQVQPSPYVPGSDTSIVGLPTFVVTGTRTLPKPEAWYYAKLPNIEVLSNASKYSTNKFLDDFQRLQIALRIVWPALMNAKTRMPTLLVLCDRNGSFDALKPRRTGVNSMRIPGGFLAEDFERTAIVMDYAYYGASAAANRTARDPYRIFYENYAMFLIRRSNEGRHLPVWFETGLSQLISTIDFTNKWIQFATIDRSIFVTPRSGPNNFFLMPLENMFSSNPRQRVAVWRPQCYLFVHLCLYGARDKYQKPFAQFLQIACDRDVTEDDFKKCFGCSYEDMRMEMRNYMNYTDYKSQVFKPKKGSAGMPQPVPADVRDATQGEIGCIKGEVFRLGGSPSEAANAEIDAYMRGERDPALLASLGLAEYQAKREDRAVRFLEAATNASVERPRAYLTLAQIRFKRETSGADEALKLDAHQIQTILDPLFVALKQPPPMPETYTLIGNTWLDSETPPTQDQMAVVLEGVKRFPANADLVYSAASLHAKYGDKATAENLIKLGQRIKTPQAMQDKFAALQASLGLPAAK